MALVEATQQIEDQEKATAERIAPQIQLTKSYKSRQPNPIDEIQGSGLFHTSGGAAVGRAPVTCVLGDQKEVAAPQVQTGKGAYVQQRIQVPSRDGANRGE